MSKNDMNDEEKEILTDIQVNSAVAREKIENVDSGLEEVKSTLEGHEERLQHVESKTERNSYVLGGVASTLGMAIATAVGSLVKWI